MLLSLEGFCCLVCVLRLGVFVWYGKLGDASRCRVVCGFCNRVCVVVACGVWNIGVWELGTVRLDWCVVCDGGCVCETRGVGGVCLSGFRGFGGL